MSEYDDHNNHGEVLSLITVMREELDRRDARMDARLDEIQRRQDLCRQKLEGWEQGAVIFKWLVIATAAIVASAASAWDWWRTHIHG